jgi:hypothetical protein
MNSANDVSNLITQLKSNGVPLSDVAWQTALACVDWAYVYGAKGQECTPEFRRKRYSDEHPTIKTKCKNFFYPVVFLFLRFSPFFVPFFVSF